jgi:hypothetical protein
LLEILTDNNYNFKLYAIIFEKKEKTAMVEKINGFEKIFKALYETDEAVKSLKNAVEKKKKYISSIKETAQISVKKIDALVDKLEKMGN